MSVTVANGAAPSPTIVLRATDVRPEKMFGNWVKAADSSAADGTVIWNTDRSVAKVVPAPVAPQHYVDITFNAEANTPYHLWIRMRAQNDYFGNDSIHVQFSDAVDAANAPIYRIGSSGAENRAVVLQEIVADPPAGLGYQGWTDWVSQIYWASCPHTIGSAAEDSL